MRWMIGLLLSLLLLTGCSLPLSLSSSRGPENPGAPTPPLDSSPAPATKADQFYDLSQNLLLSGKYELAREAAEEALRLDGDHPGALYNAGLASLRSGDLGMARFYLNRAATLQPGLGEPHLALTELYLEWQSGPLARHHLQEAQRIDPAAAKLAELSRAVEALWLYSTGQLPSGMPGSCAAFLNEITNQLCLYQSGQGRYELYLIPLDLEQRPQRVSLGHMTSPQPIITQVQLPGGHAGYWVSQLDYVVDMYQWHLFTVKDGKLTAVILTGGSEGPADVVRGFADPPVIAGREIRASSFNASRSGLIESVWELAPDLKTARLISER